jgi:NDMA-dependent alcohol dehydrogenase
MKTKAAVLHAINTPLAIEELDLDGPRAGEVLVKVAAAGVCHSDLSTINGTIPKPLPIVLGHEGAGVVMDVGPGVSLVKPGDRVILSWVPDCGHCPFCTTGKPNLCDNRSPYTNGTLADGTVRFHKGKQDVWHFGGVSCFTEYLVAPETGTIPMKTDVPLDRLALVGCAVSTGVGAVINTARVPPGSSVVVFGAGGVGLNAIQGAALVDASLIIAVDLLDNKLEMAKQFGATHTVNASRQDPVEAVRELTARLPGGPGADYAFEAIGNAKTIAQAFMAVRKGGTAVAIGIAAPNALVSIPPQWLVYGERTLTGSFYGSCRIRVDFDRMIRLYESGKLKLDELISRRIKLEEINEGFRAMEQGEVARSVILFD